MSGGGQTPLNIHPRPTHGTCPAGWWARRAPRAVRTGVGNLCASCVQDSRVHGGRDLTTVDPGSQRRLLCESRQRPQGPRSGLLFPALPLLPSTRQHPFSLSPRGGMVIVSSSSSSGIELRRCNLFPSKRPNMWGSGEFQSIHSTKLTVRKYFLLLSYYLPPYRIH